MQQDIVDKVINEASLLGKCPRILLDMAYQPAARGGERHFPAGNIRLVTEARDLLKDEAKREDLTEHQNFNESEWKDALLRLFAIKNSDEGRADREQLVLYDQSIYICVTCGGFL